MINNIQKAVDVKHNLVSVYELKKTFNTVDQYYYIKTLKNYRFCGTAKLLFKSNLVNRCKAVKTDSIGNQLKKVVCRVIEHNIIGSILSYFIT